MTDLVRAFLPDGTEIGNVHSWEWNAAPRLTWPEGVTFGLDLANGRDWTVEIVVPSRSMGRSIALMFGVPPWMIGIGKRPRQPKTTGQRGTGHHRAHRRHGSRS